MGEVTHEFPPLRQAPNRRKRAAALRLCLAALLRYAPEILNANIERENAMPPTRTPEEAEFLAYFRAIDRRAIAAVLSDYRSTGPRGYDASLVLARILKVKERISSDRELADKLARWAEGNDLGDVMREVRPGAREMAKHASGWRVDGILREFPRFDAKRIFFQYPIHKLDDEDFLKNAKAAGEDPPWMKVQRKRKEYKEAHEKELHSELATAIKECGGPGEATIKDVSECVGVGEQATRNRVKKHPSFTYKKGVIHEKVKK